MTILYTLTIFTSAFLLFLIQPMISKMLLPYLGGSPAVWNTSMMFFQILLLLGYGYAHLSGRLGSKKQWLLHLAVLAPALAWLPIAAKTDLGFDSALHPIPFVLLSLLLSVGLPFFALSATAPLIQSWLAHTNHKDAANPYFLYSASNIGSLLALASYPLIVEPMLVLPAQAKLWSALFVLLAALITGCGWLMRRHYAPAAVTRDNSPPPTTNQKLHWVVLAFFPSSLLLGVTTYITTDIASLPLFWVIPLAIYLLTVILAFARMPLMVDRAFNAQIVLVPLVLMALVFKINFLTQVLILHLFAFFALCMGCHGMLARSKPSAKYLTGFYFWMSLGGMLGGVFNALIAPIIFTEPIEYPLILILTLLTRPLLGSYANPDREKKLDLIIPAAFMAFLWLAFRLGDKLLDTYAASIVEATRLSQHGVVTVSLTQVLVVLLYLFLMLAVWLTHKRPLRFTLIILAFVLAVPLAKATGGHQPAGKVLYSERNFFGVNRVFDWPPLNARLLMHGTTLHGIQSLEAARRLHPTSYYPQLRAVVEHLPPDIRHLPAAGLGLGIGTIACFGQKGQPFDFYEIDPAVAAIAQNKEYFTYLSDCPPAAHVTLGDGRLKIAEAPDAHYGLIVIDTFSSDAIPMHIITREALAIYVSKLAPGGVMAFNISNRHLNLLPVMDALAQDAHLVAMSKSNMHPKDKLAMPSLWVVMARDTKDFGGLASDDKEWKGLAGAHPVSVWTDNFSNILGTLQ